MMHERTWGTDLATVASWETMERFGVRSPFISAQRYHFGEGFLEISSRER